MVEREIDMSKSTIKETPVEELVYLIRGEKVMLDSDLAMIYGVETKRLNEQVKRNTGRFPDDFMFQLTQKEWEALKSQNATAKNTELKSQNATSIKGGRRTLPYVFTEHGAVMLASVLNTKQAIVASVQVVRVFVKLREILSTHKQLAQKLAELENKYDSQFKKVFAALRELMSTNKVTKDHLILRKGVRE